MTNNSKRQLWTRRTRPALVVGMIATAILFLPLAKMPVAAQDAPPSYSVLHSFTARGGQNPSAALIADPAGNLYGTTVNGGPTNNGTVFKLTASGQATMLYSFTGGSDGRNPYGSLVRDPGGNLYGTALYYNNGNCGVVFKLDPTGTETVLHAFTGGDGCNPFAGLLRDAAGNLFGTTEDGGNDNAGVVFKVDAAGNETVLYSFTGHSDGRYPLAGLIEDAAGNLYGTTQNGGTVNHKCFGSGCGVVFRLDAQGNETVLYRFTGGADGAEPEAALVRDAAGNLYGTTVYGGDDSGQCAATNGPGCGVAFELNPSGQETVLHTFTPTDGAGPSGLTRDAAGNLYGTTYDYGPYGWGTVFKLAPTGQESLLHAFTGPPDAGNSQSAMLLYSGALYGTSYFGGVNDSGAVFKITLH